MKAGTMGIYALYMDQPLSITRLIRANSTFLSSRSLMRGWLNQAAKKVWKCKACEHFILNLNWQPQLFLTSDHSFLFIIINVTQSITRIIDENFDAQPKCHTIDFKYFCTKKNISMKDYMTNQNLCKTSKAKTKSSMSLNRGSSCK